MMAKKITKIKKRKKSIVGMSISPFAMRIWIMFNIVCPLHYHHELVHDLLLGCLFPHEIGIAIGAIDGGAWVH